MTTDDQALRARVSKGGRSNGDPHSRSEVPVGHRIADRDLGDARRRVLRAVFPIVRLGHRGGRERLGRLQPGPGDRDRDPLQDGPPTQQQLTLDPLVERLTRSSGVAGSLLHPEAGMLREPLPPRDNDRASQGTPPQVPNRSGAHRCARTPGLGRNLPMRPRGRCISKAWLRCLCVGSRPRLGVALSSTFGLKAEAPSRRFRRMTPIEPGR